MGWRVGAGIATGVLVLLGGGYVVADAYDVVPGVVTMAAPDPTAAPFPTPPGAVAPPPMGAALSPLATDAPVPVAAQIQAAVDALAADSRLGPRVGVLVSDLATGEVLGRAAPDVPIAPASTQKLLTAAAALVVLGDQATVDTSAVYQDGSVVLVGGGDMMLTPGAGDPVAVNGRAGLADLADQVAAKLTASGRREVALKLDDTLFTGPAVGPQWGPTDVSDGYAAPVSAVAIDVGRLNGDEGTLPGEVYAQRSADPALDAAKAFAARLGERGITVTGTPTRAAAVPDAELLGVVHSAPMWQVVDYFLEFSDNSITEAVGRVVATTTGLPGSFEGATRAVTTAVTGLGIDMTGAVLLDCSGLGRGSLLTATQLDSVVAILADPAHPVLRSAAVGMPIAGLRGTLIDRFVGKPGEGLVRAKTGSLPNTRALAGTVVTADGRQLAFTVVVDAIPEGNAWGAPQIIDAFVAGLAGCGCSG